VKALAIARGYLREDVKQLDFLLKVTSKMTDGSNMRNPNAVPGMATCFEVVSYVVKDEKLTYTVAEPIHVHSRSGGKRKRRSDDGDGDGKKNGDGDEGESPHKRMKGADSGASGVTKQNESGGDNKGKGSDGEPIDPERQRRREAYKSVNNNVHQTQDDGTVELDDGVSFRELKVSMHSQPRDVAGACAQMVRAGDPVCMMTIGPIATGKAVMAVALATEFLHKDGIDVKFQPSFVHVKMEGEMRSGMRMVVTIDDAVLRQRQTRQKAKDAAAAAAAATAAPSDETKESDMATDDADAAPAPARVNGDGKGDASDADIVDVRAGSRSRSRSRGRSFSRSHSRDRT
jgi:stage V sporulation protein S